MRLSLVLLLPVLAGCPGLSTYQVRSADDAIRMVKQAGGTGCYYGRFTGNARPYADVQGVSIVITTVGKGTTYLDCLGALPPEQRSLVVPQ